MSGVKLIALVAIYLSCFASGDEDLFEFNCKVIEDGTPLYKLKRHLFCDYDPGIRPGHGKNGTHIEAIIIPQYTKFNIFSASLEMNSWLYMEWMDPFLTWDPEEHDEIKQLSVKTTEIWIPELYSMHPSGGSMTGLPATSCKMSYKGEIVCVPSIQYTALCDSDYTHWPWDVHNCTLQLGAWAYVGEEVSFDDKSAIIIDHYRATEEWKISLPSISMRREKSKLSKNETFPTFSVSVQLSRTRTALQSALVSPVIILTAVTLTVLWLRPGCVERLILSCVNLLGHLFVLHTLHWTVPYSGNNIPNILIFYINSLILSTLALILTCWLQKLLECKRNVPVWLANLVSAIFTSKIGRVLSVNMMDPKGSALLQEDADDNNSLVEAQLETSKWERVVTVIGWISLFTFGFTYFVMGLALLC